MKWDSEEGQKILAVAYSLQDNQSNAASTPKWHMEKLVKDRVYVRYCFEEGRNVYSLQPFEAVERERPVKSVRIVSKGRKAISEETIAKIKQMRLEGHTVRSIAENLKVGRGTVEKYMK